MDQTGHGRQDGKFTSEKGVVGSRGRGRSGGGNEILGWPEHWMSEEVRKGATHFDAVVRMEHVVPEESRLTAGMIPRMLAWSCGEE